MRNERCMRFVKPKNANFGRPKPFSVRSACVLLFVVFFEGEVGLGSSWMRICTSEPPSKDQ